MGMSQRSLGLQSYNPSFYRGMRGLPALIWDGSVLDAGKSGVREDQMSLLMGCE